MPDTQPAPGWLATLLRNWAVIGPLAGVTVGAVVVGLVFEGPKLGADAITAPARIIAENQAAKAKAENDLVAQRVLHTPPTLGPLSQEEQQARAAKLKAAYGDTCLYDETPAAEDVRFPKDGKKHPCLVLPGMTVQPAPAKGG
jgi:hypothetical protein